MNASGHLPALLVSLGDGTSRLVEFEPAAGESATVGDLAAALGFDSRDALEIDGQVVDARRRLLSTALVRGSVVAEVDPLGPRGRRRHRHRRGAPSTTPAADSDALVEVLVDGGPDAGATIALGPGRHIVGSASSASVRLADPTVELHHLAIDIGDIGDGRDGAGAGDEPMSVRSRVRVMQLTGRTPCRVTPNEDGELVVYLGATRLRLRPCDTTAATVAMTATTARHPGDPWRRTLQRRPRAVAPWSEPAIELPSVVRDAPPLAGGLLAAGCSVLGGIVVAVVMSSWILLVLSGMAALGTVVTVLVGRWRGGRGRRRDRHRADAEWRRLQRELAEQRARHRAHHQLAVADLPTVMARAERLDAAIWERRRDHGDAFTVGIGWGAVTWEPIVVGPSAGEQVAAGATELVHAASEHAGVVVPVDLGPGSAIAVGGPGAAGVVRALVVALAAQAGPVDWRLVVIADCLADWRWARWVPHQAVVLASSDDRVTEALAGLGDDDRHVLVVTDRPDLLVARTGALRRFLDRGPRATVVVTPDDESVPAMCTATLATGSCGAARWRPAVRSGCGAQMVHVAGLSIEAADRAARRLAVLHDPEESFDASGLPDRPVGLGRLLAADGVPIDDPIAVAARWRRPSASPTSLIGATADGVVELDLVHDGPHGLIAGTTGSGKSELLRSIVASTAARHGPDDVTFVLVDYKGGAAFDVCAELPHVVGVVTDLDERLAARALVSLDAEIRWREGVLRDAGVSDLDGYRAATPTESMPRLPLPRLVVIVDEFAALANERPEFLSALIGIAQRGRSLGLHLLLATQRPAGVVSEDIRANTNVRIALRLNDRADAIDIVGDASPASFVRSRPGRAMLRLGPDETLVFQGAYAGESYAPATGTKVRVASIESLATEASSEDGRPTELTVLVRTIRQAASLIDLHPPRRPWLDPLPRSLADAQLESLLGAGAVSAAPRPVLGVWDDPAAQRRRPLDWDPAAGNLLLVGARGSGTSTALRRIAEVSVGHRIVAFDGRGDGGLDGLPAGALVTGRFDAERRARSIRTLDATLAARGSGAGDDGRVLVLIDGLSGLLDAVGGPAEFDEYQSLLRVLRDGPGVGVTCVASVERSGGVPSSVAATFGPRWVFHLDDPMEAAVLGVRSVDVPPDVPGRVVDAASGLVGQLALGSPAVTAASAVSEPARMATLPSDVGAEDLPAAAVADGVTSLPLGIEYATLAPTALEVPAGDHVVVIGPARSGRSGALITLAAAWCAAHPGGSVIVRCPRGSSPLAGWAASAMGDPLVPIAVAADDEELVAWMGAANDRATSSAPDAANPVLVVVDDAERVVDSDGALARSMGDARDLITVMLAGRPDALRAQYGSWTAVARRSRLGVVLAASSEADGELLGEPSPRRLPVPARPGLAWVVDGRGRRLVQLATVRSVVSR